METKYRNAQKEAQDYIDANLSGHNLTAVVLEPSPPAILDQPLLADDPTCPSLEPTDILMPFHIPGGSKNYSDFEELADFAIERWLGHFKALPALPDNWQNKMEDVHRLSMAVVSEARKQANEKFGLRYTYGGFGTPFFKNPSSGEDTQVRVEGSNLILQSGDSASSHPITSIQAAADFLGIAPSDTQREGDSPELGDLNRQLNIDPEAVGFLGNWFGLSTSVLEELRRMGLGASVVQIWPGHFDAAIELGEEHCKATYGASPGDHSHSEPYFYIGPWQDVDTGNDFWNAEGFGGASLMLSELDGQSSPRKQVLDFFVKGYQIITGSG